MKSSSASDASFLTFFFDVLQKLQQPPYLQAAVMELSNLCHTLKTRGAGLERENKADLDMIQTELVRLCQETEVDLELRLQILEVVEMRAMGWRSNRGMEEFYIEKFQEARKAKSKQLGSKGSSRSPSSEVNVVNQDQGDDNDRRQLMIGNSKLVLMSEDRQVLQLAHQQLETFFARSNNVTLVSCTGQDDTIRSTRANPAPAMVSMERLQVSYTAPEPPTASLKYSREALLILANNQQSQVSPDNWNQLKVNLPDVIIKRG